jgi:hypothetical protein
MSKTSRQVQSDIFDLLSKSSLVDIISGQVYKDGLRPRDSTLEDAVVVFTTGSAAEVLNGVVTVLLYVPDIDPYGNGVYVEDTARVETLEAAAAKWVEGMTSNVTGDYLLRLDRMIQTFGDKDINQHFISIGIRFRYWDGN